MSDLFVQKSNHFLCLNNHKIIVKNGQGQIVKEISIHLVENLLIFGQAQVTTQLLRVLAKKNVNVYYFTGEGRRIFIQAMRERMLEIHQYVEVDKKRYTFFYMADMQIKGLIRAFESLKPELYVTGYTGE
ncbi:CRISPR-associated endonuclease Cas1 [Streptococcus oralis]|uniref:CRISPR-associated endonuclease Cas1 n=1 Tax=Streptococcus jiangnanensis TaxID=3095079 RepID=A0ABU5G137_9STRE|nr:MULTISPECIES: CRISPR-associated endonuclease Cas1 [Streptococcus]AQA08809.1 CRISPR associated Cas1 family protein [Streptococcus oralis]MBN6012165.1 CRISPR-associated endonuclease Cas1 [Streptococcus oralis subsp. oralis]MCP9038389.1 CRISPR-associated endonuclease Cas1 [Streptococcus oralis]MCP9053494.1 CRISPR-associated endonuclease Cas1 [Streptococcus oralis]MCP9058858.1 CRISPR-associated endonuclease Cas1 [Streptococcus oralis]